MSAARFLIVNADDLGQSPGINRGVARAHEKGIVTAATLMVRWRAAEEAAAYARTRPDLSVGLHFDLGEWEYTGGEWRARYQVVDADDEPAVEGELRRQLEAFRRLVGHDPTHLDSHQHVHRSEPARSAIRQAGRRLGVPVRHLSSSVRYMGDFYGQDGRGWPVPEAITVDAFIGLLERLPEGVTEVGCHPAEPDDPPLASMYRDERPVELQTLCDPRVREAVDRLGIRLTGFTGARAA